MAGTQPGLIPPEILIASSNLRNKDELLEMLKEHQQAQAQQQQDVQKMAQDKAQADITATQAKAAADFALAKERQHATVHHIAETHGMFNDMIGAARPAVRSGHRGAAGGAGDDGRGEPARACTRRRRWTRRGRTICGTARCSGSTT